MKNMGIREATLKRPTGEAQPSRCHIAAHARPGMGPDRVLTRLRHTMSRTRAGAALASVIGGA